MKRASLAAAAVALVTLATGLAAQAQKASDPKVIRYGEHLSQECTTCHRRDGVDNGIPSIVGLKVDEFIEMLKYYQTGARTNPAMVSVAQSLDDEQIEALAAYFATLPPPPRKSN